MHIENMESINSTFTAALSWNLGFEVDFLKLSLFLLISFFGLAVLAYLCCVRIVFTLIRASYLNGFFLVNKDLWCTR